MIHVEPQPEPEGFDEHVRQPGLKALEEGKDPVPDYWRRSLEDLYNAYNKTCAYLCVLILRGTGAGSVDHFVAKSSRPELAYEWSNYRLASALMNSRKGVFEDVLDPFEIPDGWFVLELSFLQVLPHPDLEATTRAKVEATIVRLRLNDRDAIDARATYYEAYLEGELAFSLLERWSPFVALELKRQGRAPEVD